MLDLQTVAPNGTQQQQQQQNGGTAAAVDRPLVHGAGMQLLSIDT